MSVLVSSKLFPIDIKYAEVKLKNGLESIVVIRDEETEKRFEGKEGKIKELHTQWLQPNWKEHSDVVRQSMIWDEFKGERTMDFHSYRSMCIERFLKAWDITDDAGVPVPCNQVNIGKLDYAMANALIDLFISKSVPTEDDLKN